MNSEVNIVLPVLNEELRLRRGLEILLDYLRKHPSMKYVITIVDNGSTDQTEAIASEYAEQYSEIRYEKIKERGVGAAFRHAVEHNQSEIIGYMDIDMSTDIRTLGAMYYAMNQDNATDIFNASRFAKGAKLIGRAWYRNLISYGWMALLRLAIGTKLTDSICGFKFFRKDVIEKIFKKCSTEENGWFLIIEALIRAEREGYKIYEMPVKWIYEEHTKVELLKVAKSYVRGIYRLRNNLRQTKR